MTNASTSFLGTGWGFPVSFSNTSGEISMTSEVDDINCSLKILLSTEPGERVMQPTYGCNLNKLLFEPINVTLISLITDMIKTAIIYHEPRITLNSLDISEDNAVEGLLLITLDYTVKSTNSRFNYVYPFYKNENSNL